MMKTKKMQLLMPSVFIAAMFMSTGCDKDNPLNPLACGNGTWVTEVSNELNVLTAAAGAYNSDPTVANCENYNNAAQNYLDALEGVRSCVAVVSQADFNAAIAEAKKDIQETDCDG